MAKRYRVAFAGVHRMLERKLWGHNWASGFNADPRTEMVAVYDKGQETRDTFVQTWGPLPAYDDYEKMLREVRPDVLCIATTQKVHAEQIEAAAAASVKGILSDKPLATSMGEIDRIVAACEGRGITFCYGLDRRWHPFYRQLAPKLREGLIGDVKSVMIYGVTNLVNHGPHWYDRAFDLVGDVDVAWVTGWVDPLTNEPADSRRRLDPPGAGQVRLVNGTDLFITPYSYVKGAEVGVDVAGTRGRLAILADGRIARLWLDRDGKLEEAPLPVSLSTPTEVGPVAVADLYDAMASGGRTVCDIHAARRASEVGFAIHHSNREGGRRVAPTEIDRSLRIPSFPWGNE